MTAFTVQGPEVLTCNYTDFQHVAFNCGKIYSTHSHSESACLQPSHRTIPQMSLPHPKAGAAPWTRGPASLPSSSCGTWPQSPAVAVFAQTELFTFQTLPAPPGATWACLSWVQGLRLSEARGKAFPGAVRWPGGYPVQPVPRAPGMHRGAAGGLHGGWRRPLGLRRCGCMPGGSKPWVHTLTCAHTYSCAHVHAHTPVGIDENQVGFLLLPPLAGPVLDGPAHG